MKTYSSKQYVEQIAKAIVPSMQFNVNTDFDEWRKKAKEKLTELVGLPFEKCEDEFKITLIKDTDEFKKINFEFQSEQGYFIECEMHCPLNQEGPLPIAICLQGHTTGKHISLGQKKFESDENYYKSSNSAIQAVENGFCSIVFDQRYMGTAGQDDNGKPLCLVTRAVFPTLLTGRTPIGERVWDASRVIDILTKYFTEYIDPEKIICLGNSGGGTATFYSAALDERIFLAIPSCAFCSFDESIIPISHCGCNFIPGIRKYFDMGDIGCLIAPRKLIFANGDKDPIFPLSGALSQFETVKSAYKKLNSENNCEMVIGKGGHQFYGDDIWPVVKKMIK